MTLSLIEDRVTLPNYEVFTIKDLKAMLQQRGQTGMSRTGINKAQLIEWASRLKIGANVISELSSEGSPVYLVIDTGAEENAGNRVAKPRMIEERPPLVDISIDTTNGTASIESIADLILGGLYFLGLLNCDNASESLLSVSKWCRVYPGYKYSQDADPSIWPAPAQSGASAT